MNWTAILPLLQLIWSSVSPALKGAAIAELKTLDNASTNVLFKLLVEEAEKLVAAA